MTRKLLVLVAFVFAAVSGLHAIEPSNAIGESGVAQASSHIAQHAIHNIGAEASSHSANHIAAHKNIHVHNAPVIVEVHEC